MYTGLAKQIIQSIGYQFLGYWKWILSDEGSAQINPLKNKCAY